MDDWMFESYAEPRFFDGPAMTLAGYRQTFTREQMADIAEMWTRFGDIYGRVPGQTSMAGYGLVIGDSDASGGFDYMAAVEVTDTTGLDESFSVFQLPALRYAAFEHPHHVSELGKMINTIVAKYFPGSGFTPAKVAGRHLCIEYYGEAFNPMTGLGGMEIWVPIESKM